MKNRNLIEEMSITALEQRIEFGCCGGGGDDPGPGDPGPGPCACSPLDPQQVGDTA